MPATVGEWGVNYAWYYMVGLVMNAAETGVAAPRHSFILPQGRLRACQTGHRTNIRIAYSIHGQDEPAPPISLLLNAFPLSVAVRSSQ
jgi:hypothetical protein